MSAVAFSKNVAMISILGGALPAFGVFLATSHPTEPNPADRMSLIFCRTWSLSFSPTFDIFKNTLHSLHSLHAAMVAEVRGVFGTLTYPHLILPYLAYYGHITSYYGGPWCSPIAWWCNIEQLYVPEPSIYVKMVGLTVLSVLTMASYYTKPPPYDFLNLYEACLQAPRTPKSK